MPDDRFSAAWCRHARGEQAALLAAIQHPIAVAANPATQLFLARRMGARLRSEKVDHASPITAPELVIGMIREAVTSSMSHPSSAQRHG